MADAGKGLRTRAFALVLGAMLVLAVGTAIWVGVRAVAALNHLQQARALAAGLSPASFGNADAAELADMMDRLQRETSAARDLTDDPVWRMAEGLPWIGAQLEAASTVSIALDDVIAALGPLAEEVTAVGVEAFAPRDGIVDIGLFQEVQGTAVAAASRAKLAAESLAEIDTRRLLAPVSAAIDEASDLTGDVATGLDALARATALLPPMLGAAGPRDYLLLFQNNAEWRSLGGLVGSVALVHTEGGRFSLATQTSGGSLGYREQPVLPLDEEVLGVYGTRPGRWPANVTQLADFALAAPLAREFWRLEHGQEADGAIAIDPVALSYLLEVIGPVPLPTGDTLTAENAVQLLLNEVYLRYDDPQVQNDFFDAATASVFDAVVTRPLNPAALLSALGRAADENRLFIWSAHPEEQALLDGTTLQGRLPESDAATTRFGVYVNDGTGSKMDYYMRLETEAAWCGRDPDGSAVARLRVTIRSEAPLDIGEYTRFITGGGGYGVPAGIARTLAYVYLPWGARPLGATPSNEVGLGGGQHEGRLVYAWTSDLAPGESATLDIDVAVPATERLEVVRTADLGSGATAVPSSEDLCGASAQ